MKKKKKDIYMSKALAVLCGAFICLGLFSCSSDWEDIQTPGEERPIEFDFQLPDDGPATRVKETFELGDKIYVTVKVTCIDDSDGEAVETTEVRTSILKHDGTKFNPDPESNRLMWPKNAVKAHFTAYYLPGTHSVAPPLNGSVTIPLAELRENGKNDDLLLANQEVVNLNGIVLLRFAHTTTKLEFRGLKAAAKTIKLSSTHYLNNQIVLSYSSTEGYTHTFSNNGNNEYSVEKTVGDDDDNINYNRALFYLNVTPDWEGETFTLTQYDEGNVEIKTTPLTEKNINLHTMKMGRAYYISFYGETNNKTLEEENAWYNPKGPKKFDNVDDIQEYFKGRTSLDQDLDFNNLVLEDGVITFPATRAINFTGGIFDGGHYAIRNVYVKNGLFDNIPSGAKVMNLRLENVKVIAEDKASAGLLAPSNSGTIENVRISGNNSIGTKNVQYVGGLVGENKGTITEVQISGSLTVEAYIYNNVESSKEFAVGGLVGYNNGGVSNSEINAGGLLKAGGEYTAGDVAIGGMIGYHAKAKTVTGCNTYVRVDATKIKATNSYVGGFCGVNRGKMERSEAAGEVKGALFTERSATGGFLGYTTSLTEKTNIAVVNGCGATGNVFESDGTQAATADSELYTGGFCGFSEIDLKNVYSVGNITAATGGFSVQRRTGALTGLISAEKTIFNSFSITQKGTTDLTFNGEATCKTQNAHYRAKMLTEQGEVDNSTDATITRLNNAVSSANGYWRWSSSTTVYNGAPYLVKQ